MSTPTRCDLYVLCGGQSSRFGSDKALAPIDGMTMMQRVIHACRHGLRDLNLQHETTLVTGESQRYRELDLRSIIDQPTGIGPMGGLHAALCDRLEHHGPGWLLLTGCDWVRPSPGSVAPLIEAIDGADHSAIAYRDTHWQPLLTLYHTKMLPTIQRLLEQASYSLQTLLDEAKAQPVETTAGLDALAQANTPYELEQALQQSGVH